MRTVVLSTLLSLFSFIHARALVSYSPLSSSLNPLNVSFVDPFLCDSPDVSSTLAGDGIGIQLVYHREDRPIEVMRLPKFRATWTLATLDADTVWAISSTISGPNNITLHDVASASYDPDIFMGTCTDLKDITLRQATVAYNREDVFQAADFSTCLEVTVDSDGNVTPSRDNTTWKKPTSLGAWMHRFSFEPRDQLKADVTCSYHYGARRLVPTRSTVLWVVRVASVASCDFNFCLSDGTPFMGLPQNDRLIALVSEHHINGTEVTTDDDLPRASLAVDHLMTSLPTRQGGLLASIHVTLSVRQPLVLPFVETYTVAVGGFSIDGPPSSASSCSIEECKDVGTRSTNVSIVQWSTFECKVSCSSDASDLVRGPLRVVGTLTDAGGASGAYEAAVPLGPVDFEAPGAIVPLNTTWNTRALGVSEVISISVTPVAAALWTLRIPHTVAWVASDGVALEAGTPQTLFGESPAECVPPPDADTTLKVVVDSATVRVSSSVRGSIHVCIWAEPRLIVVRPGFVFPSFTTALAFDNARSPIRVASGWSPRIPTWDNGTLATAQPEGYPFSSAMNPGALSVIKLPNFVVWDAARSTADESPPPPLQPAEKSVPKPVEAVAYTFVGVVGSATLVLILMSGKALKASREDGRQAGEDPVVLAPPRVGGVHRRSVAQTRLDL